MGRRSVSSTKSGKYMNPTDQARKQARRKELKKNKRQRMAVRQAVLKNKDPKEIIKELDKIDKMEFNVDAPAPLSQKVLMEKRKKLKETLERVLKYYEKEDPEYWAEIRRNEAEYEKRRHHTIIYYESVKHAEEVTVDDIPLPKSVLTDTRPSQIPLPPLPSVESKVIGILKKSGPSDTELTQLEPLQIEPPGVPIGLPPEIELPEDDEYCPSDDSAFPSVATLSDGDRLKSVPVLANQPSVGMIGRPPPQLALHPPLGAIRLPPGPPPGLPPRLRMPPVPLPSLQPRIPFVSFNRPNAMGMPFASSNVLSARPQLKDPQQAATIIEAKPQLRNLSADITQFVPSALRVKRGDKKHQDKKSAIIQAQSSQQKPSRDDAYAQFMDEMKDLL